jgi:hypothetical protein
MQARLQERYSGLSRKAKIWLWIGAVFIVLAIIGSALPKPEVDTQSNAAQPQQAEQQQPEQQQPELENLYQEDVTVNLEKRGFEFADGEYGKKYYTQLGEYRNPYAMTDAYVQTTGYAYSRIFSVDTTVMYYGDPENADVSAREILGYVATLPYEGSQPNEARAWVEDNVSKVDEGVVKTATFGGASYELYGPMTARTLEIDAR